MAGFGETLRQARAHKGATLREAEQVTRINRHHLAALEDENFSALPPLIYQRGFVRNYSMYLELDPGKMSEMFEQTAGVPRANNVGVRQAQVDPFKTFAPNFAMIAFAVVLTAIMFAWGYSIWNASPPDSENQVADAPTETTQASASMADLGSTRPTPPAAPTAVATETVAPTAVATEVPAQDQTVEGRQDVAATEEPATETPEIQTGIAILVDAETHISLTVDGELVFEGSLAAGDQTDMYVGTTFQVQSSSGAHTYFVNSCEDVGSTPMSADEGDATYEFSAHEGSCPVPD